MWRNECENVRMSLGRHTDHLPGKDRTSTDQVPTKYRTSTEEVPGKYRTSTDYDSDHDKIFTCCGSAKPQHACITFSKKKPSDSLVLLTLVL